jgi:GT2 family glycosyltransferase
MNTQNQIAVVIPTWRRVKQLTTLLNALGEQIRPPDEVIVACRWDDYESIAAVKEWSYFECKIAYVYDKGHIPPLLAALGICKTEIFCLIDDDAIPARNWLKLIAQHFSDDKIGCIGGRINMYEPIGENHAMVKTENFMPSRFSWFGRSYTQLPADADFSELYEADVFGGSNMAFRTCLLRDSIDITLNGGTAAMYEADIALNIQKMGYLVLADPKLVVDHYAGPRVIDIERGWNSKQCYCYAHNLTYICLKHLKWYGKVVFLFYFFIGGQWECPAPITFFMSFLRGPKILFREQLKQSIKGRFAGIKTYINYLRKPQ